MPIKLSIKKIERLFIELELLGIIVMLLMAFAFEVLFKELPCPLCLLQRLGFLGVACGFLMNLRFGLRPSHYAMSLLSALFTSFVALRQIALHILPGTGAYGNPIFGLHLYTWSFIVSMIFIVTTTIMMGIDPQYEGTGNGHSRLLVNVLFAIVVVLIMMNLGSVLFVCGIGSCPDNP